MPAATVIFPTGWAGRKTRVIAGLPKEYFIEQLKDFKDGSRHSSEPRMGSINHMILAAKAVTPEEVEAAADYFSQLKLTKWVRVIETDTVPKTRIARGMLIPEAEGTEPIGSRIIEVPIDYEQTELRNPNSGFIAYVPKGSLKAGEALVRTGGDGTTIACTICHGSEPSWPGQYSRNRGPLAEPDDAAAHRLQRRRKERSWGCTDEAAR